MFKREIRYARRNHPKKPSYWMKARYFGPFNPNCRDQWVFGDKASGMHLLKFAWCKIARHVLVKGTASPDDGALQGYWALRNQKRSQDLKPSRARIAQRQQGYCLHCGAFLFDGEDIQLHHKVAKAAGGTDRYENLELLHLFCHQQIHAKAQRSETLKISELLEPCA